MKSYTDLEQSKVLSKILPLESADQTWARIAITGANLDVPEELQYRHNGDIPFQYYSGIGTPCWSLASLLDVLPSSIKDSIGMVFSINMNKEYIEYSNPNISSLCSAYIHTCGNDNLVDACYEMILKLNELNLL